MQESGQIPNKCLDDANPALAVLWCQIDLKHVCVYENQ